jgi:hypothetical protein
MKFVSLRAIVVIKVADDKTFGTGHRGLEGNAFVARKGEADEGLRRRKF